MTDEKAQAKTHNGSDAQTAPTPELTLTRAVVQLLSPIPFTVLLILTSVLLLIGANVLGWDTGRVLTRMGDHEFARGLITYLFAVTTIGTAVVLLLSALMGKLVVDEAFQRGKEILALLLGVFGTIVGFYFGSEAHADVAGRGLLSLSQPLLSQTTATAGGSVHVTAFVSGGIPPYSYGVAADTSADIAYQNPVETTGWIVEDVPVAESTTVKTVRMRLGVTDSTASRVTKEFVITVTPPSRGP
jgi:hypothetical protein